MTYWHTWDTYEIHPCQNPLINDILTTQYHPDDIRFSLYYVIIIIICQVFAWAFHIHIAAKDICPSLHFEFFPPSFPFHFLEALDNFRWAYHAFFFHAVASRKELWILVPPELNSSDPQTSCSKAWLWHLNKADCHIIVHLLHVDSNVHLEENAACTYICHLAVTHGPSLRSRILLHTAEYSQWQLWRIISLAILGDWTSRCCPVYTVLARFLLCMMLISGCCTNPQTKALKIGNTFKILSL